MVGVVVGAAHISKLGRCDKRTLPVVKSKLVACTGVVYIGTHSSAASIAVAARDA